jgi:hypothetical protein
VLGCIKFDSLFIVFLLDFGTVPTLRYFYFFSFYDRAFYVVHALINSKSGGVLPSNADTKLQNTNFMSVLGNNLPNFAGHV